jgi:hypothetical protein
MSICLDEPVSIFLLHVPIKNLERQKPAVFLKSCHENKGIAGRNGFCTIAAISAIRFAWQTII